MIPYIRRKKILEYLHSKELVYFEELVQVTQVSMATIRRDIKLFEDEGQVEILQGGAARIKITVPERNVKEKLTINQDMKELIAGYATTLVNDGQFIFIGPGTTENWMFRNLRDKGISVVTNGALHIAQIIENNISSQLLGGTLANDIAVITGGNALKELSTMHFDKCFIGASGVSLEFGASTSQSGVAEINMLAMERSKKSYLLVDSTKIGIDSKYIFASLDQFEQIISAGNPPDEYRELENFNTVDSDS